ncbi:unnamed protein product [Chironomus riparius]|uniref:Uncharacterized protein n=1 Tax=Chironomus riparius TaxID=315576 RepID=A0A9N9WXA5_9DIPT|nr:unnamed protein product [Chironomus riparius]
MEIPSNNDLSALHVCVNKSFKTHQFFEVTTTESLTYQPALTRHYNGLCRSGILPEGQNEKSLKLNHFKSQIYTWLSSQFIIRIAGQSHSR